MLWVGEDYGAKSTETGGRPVTLPPSIPRALDLIEQVADNAEASSEEADSHEATRAANRIMLTLKSSDGLPPETLDAAEDLCNRIRGAVKYVGDHPSDAAAAAGDMRHCARELRQLLYGPPPSSPGNP